MADMKAVLDSADRNLEASIDRWIDLCEQLQDPPLPEERGLLYDRTSS